nr:MAG TPA: hypothetical protein [Caudoviricetes sp.]
MAELSILVDAHPCRYLNVTIPYVKQINASFI